jgi:hypothetical protein
MDGIRHAGFKSRMPQIHFANLDGYAAHIVAEANEAASFRRIFLSVRKSSHGWIHVSLDE